MGIEQVQAGLRQLGLQLFPLSSKVHPALFTTNILHVQSRSLRHICLLFRNCVFQKLRMPKTLSLGLLCIALAKANMNNTTSRLGFSGQIQK